MDHALLWHVVVASGEPADLYFETGIFENASAFEERLLGFELVAEGLKLWQVSQRMLFKPGKGAGRPLAVTLQGENWLVREKKTSHKEDSERRG
jgi:hypothetical protein